MSLSAFPILGTNDSRSIVRGRVRTKTILAAGVLGVAGSMSLPAFARDFTIGSITVEQPWSRATPGGSKTGIGYLTIRNNGDVPDRLLGVTTTVSEKASPHTMSMKDGVMVMRPVTGGLAVPARGSVVLKPGSDHLMLEGLKRPLKKGDSFPAVLTFEKAGKLPVTFDVEGIGAQAPSGAAQAPTSND